MLRAVARAARVPVLQSLIVAFIDLAGRARVLSGVVRTRVIDDFVTGALATAARSCLLLGAGYDTRATRLPAAATSTAFEVDHPVTQARKHKAARTLGAVRYVSLDLESDLSRRRSSTPGSTPPAHLCCLGGLSATSLLRRSM